MQGKSPFQGGTGHVQRRHVWNWKGLMALQQHCDVGTVPTQQMRDMELAQAWQDLVSVLITTVSSWPPSAVDSGKILRCFQDVGERLEERLRQEGGGRCQLWSQQFRYG